MRTIDADAIPYTMIYRENWMRGTGGEEQAAWKSAIDAMPTIEPERKKGKWYCSDDIYESGVCSACKFDTGELYVACKRWFNFCPNCGADMRGEQE